MLFEKIDETCQKINALNFGDVQAFAEHALLNYPALQKTSGPPTGDTIVSCTVALGGIKHIPAWVNGLRRLADAENTPAALRTTILLALTYLVQPQDEIRDTAPGGYGYIDDLIILSAIMQEAGKVMGRPLKSFEDAMQFVLSILPPAKRAEVVSTANRIAALFQLMQQFPEAILAITNEAIIENPLVAEAPTNIPGFTPMPTYTIPDRGLSGRSYPGGGGILSEPGGFTAVNFSGGGGVAMVGNDIVTY